MIKPYLILFSSFLFICKTAYSFTMEIPSGMQYTDITKEGDSYKIKWCKFSQTEDKHICETDIINSKIIERRHIERSEKLKEMFSTPEKVSQIKERMKKDIEETGDARIELMPGAVLKADNTFMLDMLFSMVENEIKNLDNRREEVLAYSRMFFKHIDSQSSKKVKVPFNIFQKQMKELESKLLLEMKEDSEILDKGKNYIGSSYSENINDSSRSKTKPLIQESNAEENNENFSGEK